MADADPILSRKAPLGPYAIVKKLGEGGMGGVYLGQHKVLQVYHAIKVVHPRMTSDPQLIERFFREARHAAKLNHPNIVQTVGADVVDGVYYLAMQFVEGKTLGQMARAGAMNIHQAVRYVHMIANALAYAHSRKVIHRDIKPANIMVDADDTAKLMDFGLVRDMSQGQQPEQEPQQQLTMAGFIVGTPQYMPPEQWHGEGVDHRSDIYSLGVTLYHLLSGWYPYTGRTSADIFRSVMAGKPTPLRMKAPAVDAELAAIVEKAAQARQEDRFQSSQDFAMALDEWWQGHPPESDTALMRVPVAEPGPGSISGATRGRTSITPDLASRTGRSTRSATSQSGGSGGGEGVTGDSAAAANPESGPPAGSSPTIMQAPASNKTLLVAVVVIVLALAGIGAVVVASLGNRGGEKDGMATGLKFSLDIPAGAAVESAPLYVATTEFSIPGQSNGEISVNGEAYKLGAALKLNKGLNKLVISAAAPGGDKQIRTLFVVCDTDAPQISAPLLARTFDGRIPTEAASFTVSGSVKDDQPGVTVELLVDGVSRELVLSDAGGFEHSVPLADKPVQIELRASDRAGNRARPVNVWLVPDRKAPEIEWSGSRPDKSFWSAAGSVKMEGRLNKIEGVTLVSAGVPVEVKADGIFELAAELAEGRHRIKLEATDWLDRKATFEREVVVKLSPPRFEQIQPADNAEFTYETLPAVVTVSGRLGDAEITLKCGDKTVAVGADGGFKLDQSVTAFGPLTLSLEARDPLGRVTTKKLTLVIKRLQYRPMGKNAQGFAEFERVKDGAVMVEIPAGEFMQGVSDGLPDAKARKVKLSAFLIAKYETTKEQFCKFLNESKIDRDGIRSYVASDKSGGFHHLELSGGRWQPSPGTERQPVVGVTWRGAQEYCRWADPEGSLPSEAQWEYAARGSDGRAYPWGNENPGAERAHYEDSGLPESEQVVDICRRGLSPFGIFNMAGNVEEWCLDWYAAGAYGSGDAQDPRVIDKPPVGDLRVVRGGSFKSSWRRDLRIPGEKDPGDLRSFVRQRRAPDSGADDRGFRCAAPQPH